jgi:hypothetical protein
MSDDADEPFPGGGYSPSDASTLKASRPPANTDLPFCSTMRAAVRPQVFSVRVAVRSFTDN